MATHSSILAWRIPWTEEPGRPWGRRESDMTEVTGHEHPALYLRKTRGFHFPSGHLSSLDNREQQKNMRNRGESEV